ncbi:MAG: type II toxin-antitoxin system Phd/YefM family antitoxin [Pseudonocardia sp.]|nr:type II toxin-antitoxin system Phd/YefM family antitoxin [Pseudonocardia sp.]
MGTHSLRELRSSLGAVVREVAYGGHEAIVTDNGREIAVIISLEDYERLHEHADVADALRLRELREVDYRRMSLEEMLTALGVSIDELDQLAG